MWKWSGPLIVIVGGILREKRKTAKLEESKVMLRKVHLAITRFDFAL